MSAQSQGGSFESGFLSAGLSQGVGQYMDANGLGYAKNAQGMDIAYNAGVAAVLGGTISSVTGGSFESGALNAAMGRLFNDGAHAGLLGTLGIGYGEYGAAVRGFVTTAGEWLAGSNAVAAGRAGAVGIMGWAVFHSDEIGPEEVHPSTPVGHEGNEVQVKPGTNSPTTIEGREYTGHSLDRMQGRGIPPSVVEDAILNGTSNAGKRPNTIEHKSQENRIRVITNESGVVITVIPR